MISAFFTADSATALGKSRRRREILRCEREREKKRIIFWKRGVGGRRLEGAVIGEKERERERETWRNRKRQVSSI